MGSTWERGSYEECRRRQLGPITLNHLGPQEDPEIHIDHDFLIGSRSPPQVEAMVGTEQPSATQMEKSWPRCEPWPPAAAPSSQSGTQPSLDSGWGGWLEEASPAKGEQVELPYFSHSLLHLSFCLLEPWICLFIQQALIRHLVCVRP